MATERTLVILKPDAVERRLVEQIVHYFIKAGLKTIAGKGIEKATKEQLDNHFPNTDEWMRNMGARAAERIKNEFRKDPVECFNTKDPLEIGKKIAEGCRDYYLSGQLVAIVLEGENAVEVVRTLIGKTMPSKAGKGTIRGDLGIHEKFEDLINGAARNLIHASDSVEEAEREMAAWFVQFAQEEDPV